MQLIKNGVFQSKKYLETQVSETIIPVQNTLKRLQKEVT